MLTRQTSLPEAASRQMTSPSVLVTKMRSPSVVGVDRGPSAPVLVNRPDACLPQDLGPHLLGGQRHTARLRDLPWCRSGQPCHRNAGESRLPDHRSSTPKAWPTLRPFLHQTGLGRFPIAIRVLATEASQRPSSGFTPQESPQRTPERQNEPHERGSRKGNDSLQTPPHYHRQQSEPDSRTFTDWDPYVLSLILRRNARSRLPVLS